MKADYLKPVKAAGYSDVKIIEETSFPLDDMVNDPTAKMIMNDLNVTSDQVKDVSSAIASIKLSARKP
jgi:hypothetical protein